MEVLSPHWLCYLWSLDLGPSEVAAARRCPGRRLARGGRVSEAVDEVWLLSLTEKPI